jgi:hypothetical protein
VTGAGGLAAEPIADSHTRNIVPQLVRPPPTSLAVDVRQFRRRTALIVSVADDQSMEGRMKTTDGTRIVVVLATASLFAGCSSWDRMDRAEGTAVGGAGGAVAGAVVAGPVGAVVGGVGGAYVGHETTGKDTNERVATARPATSAHEPSLVRSVQQALNDRGYNAGVVDGQWGPATRDAVRRFQQATGLAQTGELDNGTLTALGVSTRDIVAKTQ